MTDVMIKAFIELYDKLNDGQIHTLRLEHGFLTTDVSSCGVCDLCFEGIDLDSVITDLRELTY
jgi:hypothetical protein